MMQTVKALDLFSCVCSCMCVFGLNHDTAVSVIILHLIFETWSLPGPGPLPFWLGWLASETQRFFCLAYPSSRIMNATVPNFSRCWGSKLRSWFLHFACCVISPPPMLWHISWFTVYYICRSSSLPIRMMMLTRIFVIQSQGVFLESETKCWVMNGLAQSSKPMAVFSWKRWKNM